MNKKKLVVAIACVLCASLNQRAYSANDIEIVSGSGLTNISQIVESDDSVSFISNADTASIGIDDVLVPYGTNPRPPIISLSTGDIGSELGNLTLNTALDFDGQYTATTYNLAAHNNILLTSSITDSDLTSGHLLILNLNPDSDEDGLGEVILSGSVEGRVDTIISGDLTIGATGSYSLDSNGYYSSALTVDSINVEEGGIFNFTAGSLNVTNSGLVVGSTGLLGNDVSLTNYMSLTLSNNNVLNIDADASFSMQYGTSLNVGSINNNGSFNYSGGYLTLTNSGLTIGDDGLLGSAVSISSSSGIHLLNDSVLTIDDGATLNMYGGSSSAITAGSIENNGTFSFQSGNLNLTNSDLTIGDTGLLGANVALSNSRYLGISGNVDVEEGASLSITDDGAPYAQNHFQGQLNNFGVVNVNSLGQLTVDGVITNDGEAASLTVDGGATLTTGSINNTNGGSFAFGTGNLNLTNSDLTVGDTGLLGNNVVVSPTRNLSVSGDITIDDESVLSLYGGVLSAGSIDNTNGGLFNYSSGHLSLTNSGLTVGTTGLLGDNLELSGTRFMTVAGDVSVEAAANLVVGNSISNSQTHFLSNLNNAGTVSVDDSLASPAGHLTVDGIITNDGAVASLNVDGGTLTAGGINNINNASLTMSSGTLTTDSISNVDGASTVVNGGTLAVGNISNATGGSFAFNAGYLNLTNSGLVIGSSGLLGNNVALTSARRLSVAGDVSVENAATLSITNNNGYYPNSFLSNLNNSGSVTINNGELDVDGTITNDGATASLSLDGGYLYAGSINNVNNGSFNFTAGRLTLTDSSLTIGSGELLGDNLTLSADRELYLTSSNVSDRTLTVEADSSLTLDGGTLSVGAIDKVGSFNFISGDLDLNNSSLVVGVGGLLGETLTLDAGMDIDIYGGNGLVVDTGANFTLNGGSLSTGSITNNGSFIYNSGNLSSSGDLSISGNSTYSVDSGSSFRLGSGGTLNIESGAALELNGGQVSVGSIAGSFGFNSGALTLTNSDLVIGDGELLGSSVVLGAGKILRLDHYQYDYTLDGVLSIDAGSSLSLDGGHLRAGSVNNSGDFNFNSGSLELTNSDLSVGSNGLLGNTITLDASKYLWVNGEVVLESGSNMSLEGGELYMRDVTQNGGNFNFSTGVLRIGHAMTVGAGGLLGNSVSLSSTRTLNVGDLTVNGGAAVTVNSGFQDLGYLRNYGTVTVNSGEVTLYDSGVRSGNFNFNAGKLNVANNFTVGSNGLLGNSLALSSARQLDVHSTVTVNNGANLSVNSGYMQFDHLRNRGTVAVTGGTLNVDGYSYYGNNGTVENTGTVRVEADAVMQVDGQSYVQNGGHTNIETGGTLNIYSSEGSTYTQNAGETTINGELIASTVVINGGELNGAGTITGNLEVWGGALKPGNSPGSINVLGDFILTEAGTLQLEVASDGGTGFTWDELIVNGSYDFQEGGSVFISLSDGIDIEGFGTNFTMDSFFQSGVAGSSVGVDLQSDIFASVDLYAYEADETGLATAWYSLAFDEAGTFASEVTTAPPSAVPVPAAVWLFSSGLIGLFGVAKRRKAA